ncbi:MAG: Hsp20/alpha crystallin family protein [Thermogutta sp.]
MAMPHFGPPSLDQFRREFDRLLNSFLGELPESGLPLTGRHRIPVNVWETPEAFFIEAEVPGVTTDQVDISVLGNEVTLRVNRPQPPEENVTYHRRERQMGECSRAIKLPSEFDPDRVQADLRNGVLTITLPKSETVRPRKVQINLR